MRVLWTHNFDPNLKNSGRFMYLLAEGVRKLGIDLELSYLGNLRSISNLYRAREKVRRIADEFDILHAQFGSACAFATAVATKIPKVLSLRGSDWYWYKEKLNYHAIHGFISSLMTRMVICNYDIVVAMSHRMVKDIRSFYPNLPVLFIPDPINIQFFKPLNKQPARSTLGFPDNNDKWVLFTTLTKTNSIKRTSLAIESVRRANYQMGGIYIRIASGLNYEEMPLFVGSCDMVLCTSVYEGWPNSIKEALACNLPFVSTDVSDLSEISKNESSCRICPPDAKILADNICEVLSTSGTIDLRPYIKEMDVPLISLKLVELYQDLVSKNGARRNSHRFGPSSLS